MAKIDWGTAAKAAGQNIINPTKWGKALDNINQRYFVQDMGLKSFLPQRAMAAPSDYLWEDNGTGGINYFVVVNGEKQPISNADYQSGTGVDVAKLESDHLNEYKSAHPAPNPIADSGTGSGTGGSVQSNKVVGPDGGIYDLATPDGIAGYKVAKENWINEQYGKYTSEFATDLKRSKEDNATQMLSLGRSKKNFYGDATSGDIGSYKRDLNSLATNRDAAQQSVMGKFLNLGPNVYQSAEGENLGAVGNIYDQGVVQAENQKADAEANFGTADTAIKRTAEDLALQETEQPKYFENWKAQGLAQNTVDVDSAKTAISSAAAKAKASTPTFQEKSLNFLSDAASKFNPYVNSSVYNSVIAPSLAKSSGVNLAFGSDLYNDAKIPADPSSFSQDQVDNIYKKYGLLN